MISNVLHNQSLDEKLLIDYASTLIAWANFVPLSYIGVIGGSEFLVYNAGKVYIATRLEFAYGGSNVGVPSATMYDMANAVNFTAASNVSMAWNTTGAAFNFFGNLIKLQNIWFSRCAVAIVAYMRFTGFKLTV